MKVSIIIPTYNRADILKLTLASLENQSIGRENYEVIVVDDGSTDNTREIVSSFDKSLSVIYYFQEDKGYRVALARNEGIKRANGEILIFLDSGMVVGSAFAIEHYKAHLNDISTSREPRIKKTAVIGYVYGYNFYLDSCYDPQKINYNNSDFTIKEFERTQQYLDIREDLYQDFNDDLGLLPAPWTIFWTTNVSVSRNAIIEARCFDENFITWGMEDLELAYRLQKCGTTFKLSRKASGLHYPHERNNSTNFASNEDNKQYFYKKHPDLPIELFMKSKPLRFNKEYRDFLSCREKAGKTHLYSELITEEGYFTLKNEISSYNNIIFGCQDGFLLNICKSKVGLEYDERLASLAKSKNPAVPIYTSIGLLTGFEYKKFEVSIIASSGYALPEPFLSSLFQEADRISYNVFWIENPENARRFNNTNYNKVEDLGDNLVLYKVI